MRSFAAVNAGTRSGSSRQNVNERCDPDPVEHREHLVGPAAHAVDVVAEVGVGVEEDGAAGTSASTRSVTSSRIPCARSSASAPILSSR